MFGEEGNDWLRGGTNKDVYDGGTNENDNDVASFVTATPSGSHAAGFNGVVVNLSGETQDGVPAHEARGEGNDEVKGIESVVGSPFNDLIVGSERPNQHLYGGMGANECKPGPCEEPATKLTPPFAYLDLYSPFSNGTPTPDPSFVVVGGASSESLGLTNTSGGFQASASVSGVSEALTTTGPRSHGVSEGEVNCSLSPKPIGGGAAAFGGEGGDAITVTNGLPEGMSVDIDGGDGSDTLTGSSSGEDFFSGNSGSDVMHGGAGSDALISEGTGADELYGESGNDQLVTNNPCEGVLFSGGEDTDIAGFARTVPGENGAPANGGSTGSTRGSAKAPHTAAPTSSTRPKTATCAPAARKPASAGTSRCSRQPGSTTNSSATKRATRSGAAKETTNSSVPAATTRSKAKRATTACTAAPA